MRTMPGRRVQGLRRDEVAQLAGISPEYYLRLEQGRGHQPSEQVLRSLARALHLNEGALSYMVRLVRIQSGSFRPVEHSRLLGAVEASLAKLLANWSTTPAFLTDRNQTVVMSNGLADVIVPGAMRPGSNLVLNVFGGDWRVADLGWEASARRFVSALRFYGDPHSTGFQDIVGLLSMRDGDFQRLWAAHEAAPLDRSELRLDIAGFGRVEFAVQCLTMTGDEDHVLTVLLPEPGSIAADAIKALRIAQASGSADLRIREPA
jgi:transcriptional regulator with XRE-family HTH domain